MIINDIYSKTINLLVLGYVVKRLREKQSLSLRKLADKVKNIQIDNKDVSIDQSFISYIERGERVLSYQILTALSAALNVKAPWLISLSLPVHPRIHGQKIKSPSDSGFADVDLQFDNLTKQVQENLIDKLFNVDFDTFIDDYIEYANSVKPTKSEV